MKGRVLLCALVAGLVGFGPAAIAAPTNDDFADAETISIGQTISTSTIGATDELLEPSNCSGGSAIWYRFDATEDGMVALDTAGSNFDTSITVYVGSANPPVWDLSEVACNDDSSESLQASLSFEASGGVTYYVQAGGFADDQGSLTLEMFRPGAIAGSVLLAGDEQPAWACVTAHDAVTGDPAAGSWTQDDGSYRIDPLKAGNYKIRISACGGPFFPTEWYDNQPSIDLADTVVVVAGQATQDINATVTVADPEPSSIDIAVLSMSIENVPLKTDFGTHGGTGTVRDVTITIENVGVESAEGFVDVVACPATTGFCQAGGGIYVDNIEPGETRTATVRWNGAGGFGDYSVEAYASFTDHSYETYDENWDNNWVAQQHYLIVGGTGFGVGV